MTERREGAPALPHGLDRLSGPLLFTAEDPASFRATLDRVQLDHVALEAVTATVHRSERAPQQILRHPTALLAVLFVTEGTLQVEAPDEAFEISDGQCAVIDDRGVTAIAHELRAAGSSSTAEIAARFSFFDEHQMTQAFSGRFGMTPTPYRAGGRRHLG